jgi:hypothetical protein
LGIGVYLGYLGCFTYFIFLALIVGGKSFGALEDIPPSNFLPGVGEWADQALLLAKERFDDWQDDLDAQQSSGFSGLQLHATPIAELRVPLRKLRFPFYGLRPQIIYRSSTRHLADLRIIADQARNETQYDDKLAALDSNGWTKALSNFDHHFRWRLESLVGHFNESVDAFHDRHSPPSSFEMVKLTDQYLELWTVAGLWYFGREDLIKRVVRTGYWRGDAGQHYTDHIELVANCRVALLRMNDSKYRW